ncbi:MAG: sensor domain-containing diguanylate cyclase, partial [Pseudomonadota bacterium]
MTQPTVLPSSLPRALPVGEQQRKFAIGAVVALVVATVVLTPLAGVPMAPMPGYMTAFGMAMLLANGLLAALLFSRGLSERDSATVRLGTAYFFVAIIVVPLVAVFPDAVVPGALLGDTRSPAWLWTFWHAGFGLAVLRYALAVQRRTYRGVERTGEIVGTLAIAAVLTWLSTAGVAYLPAVMAEGQTFLTGGGRLMSLLVIGINACALLWVWRLKEPTPEQLWLRVGMVAACVDVWLTYCGGSERFTLGWYAAKGGSVITSLTVLLSLFHDVTVLYRRASTANQLLEKLAHQDGLTGLFNQRRFDEGLHKEWRRCRRNRTDLSLLMVDIDFFRLYNERYGHLRGDDCLKQVAQVLEECFQRPGDLVVRSGGEEFAVLLPETHTAGAARMAERIREALVARDILHEDGIERRLTVSIGLSTAHPSEQSEPGVLLKRADDALYQAKAMGRNCIESVHADPLLAPAS